MYIETTKELNWNEKIKYRKLFKDDGQRIVLDLLKKEELKDVLFSLRYNNGIITREIFIEYYSALRESNKCLAAKPDTVDKTNKQRIVLDLLKKEELKDVLSTLIQLIKLTNCQH